jgi:hypothetical protein
MSIIARTSTGPRVHVITTAPARSTPAAGPDNLAAAARWASDHRDLIGYGTLAAGIEAATIVVGYTTGGPIVGAVLGSLLPGLAAATGSVVVFSRWSVDRHAQAVSDGYRDARDPSA